MLKVTIRPVVATIALACLFFCTTALPAAARKSPDEPDVRSNAVLVLDLTDDSVLFSRKPDLASPIASITKLMTALVVLDGKQPMSEIIELTKADRAVGKGAYSRLPIGAKLSRADLLRLALMSSENRAANALGRSYPGGLSAFVKTMNRKAKALGMTRTYFADPSGLSMKNVASPRDLTKLVAAADSNGIIREYSTSRSHSVSIGRRRLEFHNTNSLVSNPSWSIDIQKTGYTNEAGHCLVMQARIDDHPILMVLLDSFGKYTRVADAKRIRQWMQTRPPPRTASL